MTRSRSWPALTALLAALAALPSAAQPFRSQTHEPKVKIAWNRLYPYDELVGHLRRLAAAYPELLILEEIGRSSQGRPIWAARIANPRTGPEARKAGMFIDGNIHGNEVQGGDACLYTVWYLLEHYGKLEAVTRLVDERVFYVVPVTNVDGRAWWFARPSNAHWPRSGLLPYDDDKDGEADEDGPEDLDGDGEITQMRKRVADGSGTHRLSPDDPRVLVPVEKGQKGDYILLGSEGIDNDGDGRVNEDPPGGGDMNRNWPADWQPRYVQYGAGNYPLSHPETRAVAEYVLARPNIAGFQSYHNSGGMILRGPGTRHLPAYPAADVAVYDKLGQIGERMLPFYRYMIVWRDLYNVHGGEVTWAAEALGVISFTNELWAGAQMTGGRDLPDLERVRWIDRVLLGEAYSPWKPYDHPTYGRIEIGGTKAMFGRVPPAFMIEELLHRNCAFTLVHADSLPRVELGGVTVGSLGGGVWQVEVTARNDRLIPTRTARMAEKRIGRRDLFSAGGQGLKVLAGGRIEGGAAPRLVLAEKDPARLWIDGGIASHGKVEVRWVVQGAGTLRVAYDAEKGGRAEREVPLR